jgi:polysaccharide deacetylase family protein (PEP-CTERM system associated)
MSRPLHAFTVDLEEWFHGIELSQDAWPTQSRLRVGLDPLLELLDEHQVKATFFVLGAVAERFPGVVSELAQEGHEIGCHGHAHDFVYRQSPDEFRADLRRSRDIVSDAAGVAPRGFRAPYFSIRRDSLWAIDILAEEGFGYDSSIFPVQNYRYGIPDAPCEPHDIATPTGSLREVPLTPIQVLGRNIPFSGGAYLRILPWWAQRAAWALASRRGQSVMTYIHPWELDPKHPVLHLPRRVALTHYARLGLTERRLRRLLTAFSFGRLDEVFPLA